MASINFEGGCKSAIALDTYPLLLIPLHPAFALGFHLFFVAFFSSNLSHTTFWHGLGKRDTLARSKQNILGIAQADERQDVELLRKRSPSISIRLTLQLPRSHKRQV
ncbi:hypothetical protein BV372_25845 [Nostoc sp. T09]|uniref:hypothetical protein n=1 Tax=Nostoc sp. T09 TaxID=1932621 RepID=UPI000A3AE3C9|nr:hypothetical protein [Nostoc sp. T09]OUL27503.1 hypothetical protein BV372_25845 [Nostoc sp. T09]